MRGQVKRAISITKPRLHSERAGAVLSSIDALAEYIERQTPRLSPNEFSRALVSRMADLGWTLPNIRATVERETKEAASLRC